MKKSIARTLGFQTDQKFAHLPLVEPADDRLNLNYFVVQVAATIKNRIEDGGIRIGIYGTAGAGKTSVLNFLARQFKDDQSILFIKFNPWLRSDEIQLFHQFYLTIAEACGMSTRGTEDLAPYVEIVTSFAKVASQASGLTAVLTKLLEQLMAVSAAEDKLVKDKKLIEKALDLTERKIIVALDDFDCLSDDQIQATLRFIEIVSIFSEITFVVACDKERVMTAIAPNYGGNLGAKKFVEKLLLEERFLPPVSETALSELTIAGLDYILGGGRSSPANITGSESKRLTKRFDSVFGCRLGTPRCVKSYLSEVEFNSRPLAGEVDPLQFAFVEALRHFYPRSYALIQNNPDLFTGATPAKVDNQEKRRARKIISDSFEDLPDGRRLPIVEDLARLFPVVAVYFDLKNFASFSESDLRRSQSIASKDYFYRYFEYRLRPGDISDDVVRKLFFSPFSNGRNLSLRDDLSKLTRTAGHYLLIKKIARLAEEIPTARISEAVCALASFGFHLTHHKYTMDSEPAPLSQNCDLICRLIARLEKVEDRDQVAGKIFNRLPQATFAFECAAHLLYKPAAGTNVQSQQLLSEACSKEIYENIVELIKRGKPNTGGMRVEFGEYSLPLFESLRKSDAALLDDFLTIQFRRYPAGFAKFINGTAISEFGLLPKTVTRDAVQKWVERITDIIPAPVLETFFAEKSPVPDLSFANDNVMEITSQTIAEIFIIFSIKENLN